MRDIILDAGRLIQRREAQDYLRESFGFPEYYGMNLDALHDMLTGLPETRVTVVGAVSGYGERVLAVLRHSAGENPRLELVQGHSYDRPNAADPS